ncbi:MAG: PQQ-binding-like beta-propeller repeat protein [Woeseiaceae bacterium]|nr:PQQ-binding-like beta-propeller repeat protein [Woeseiaceae bacterium]
MVQLGCGDGKLTAALCTGDGYIVQGLDADAANVAQTLTHIRTSGLYGKATAKQFEGTSLPYIDNMVNLVVSEDLGGVSMAEVMRVLSPGSVAYIKRGGVWEKNVKPIPGAIDEWTHYMYDATNNAVSRDKALGPPRQHQWIGDPKWSRSHEHMSAMNAMVSSGGRIFYIIDEGSRASITLPARWTLVARDAYNGVILWKRTLPSWHTHLWPLKSGPAQLPRRLVAIDDRVYLPLGLGEPLSALDAATGEIQQTFGDTTNVEEVVISDGVIYVLTGTFSKEQQSYRHRTPDVWEAGDEAKLKYAWDDRARNIVALNQKTGALLWKCEYPVVQLTPAVDETQLYFYDGTKVVALNKDTGVEQWHSEEVTVTAYELGTAYAPTLVAYQDVVLYSGGERKMSAFAKTNGETLWTEEHAESGHHSPEDVLCIDGLVWSGAIARIKQQGGTFVGRNPRTGAVESEFPLDVEVNWFHHRCHRSKAADGYILSAGTGTEFVDVRNKNWTIHHWARGACLYGIMPANGMLYVPPNPCACFIESKIHGMNALTPAPATPQTRPTITAEARLEKGPAYGQALRASQHDQDWPMYRYNPARSGVTKAAVPEKLEPAWKTELGGKLTPPVAAHGQVLIASVETHTVHALDQASGKENWRYSAEGRIDSPPTIWQGRVYFGSADGWVYCLDALKGTLVWRFLAAPNSRQLVARRQLESVWPVHGSVLIENDTLYCLAGRSIFLDGGIRFYQLNPETGKLLLERVWDDRDPDTGENMQTRIRGLAMPVALTDLLSSDGEHLYMRSQQLDKDGTRSFEKITLKDNVSKHVHLFATAGFLDDSWFHRTMWIYGYESGNGWGGWMKPGLTVPVGRILSVAGDRVCGFGRRPAFFSQSSVSEYQLYSATPQFDGAYLKDTRKVTKESGYLIDNWQNNNRLPAKKLTLLDYNWRNEDLPFFARALVLAGETLLVAGPPDMIDETVAWGSFEKERVRATLKQQEAALEGKHGGLLWAVSAQNGKKLGEYKLESPPVFDGMAVVDGQLFMSTLDGCIRCWK